MIFDICFGIGWFAVCGFAIYMLWKRDQPVSIDPDLVDAPRVEYFMNGTLHIEHVQDFMVCDGNIIWFLTTDGLEFTLSCDEWVYIAGDE